MKYFILFQERKKSNLYYLLGLKDGFFYKAIFINQRKNNFCEDPVTTPLSNKTKGYRRIRTSEIDSLPFKEGINLFINDPQIKEKLIEKIISSRYITPKVHNLDYLKEFLKTKELEELKKEVTTSTSPNLSNLSFPIIENLQKAIFDNYQKTFFSEKLTRFIFPLEV